MDVTQKTVTSASMLDGVTALKNDGTDITGSYVAPTFTTQSKTVSPTTSQQTVSPDAGYDGLSSVTVNAMPSGSASTPATTITANPTISVSSGGLITASVSGSQSVTPTVSAGYVSSGTAGTVTVSGSNTQQLTTQAAQTITPTTTNQTIASGKYLTGAQTIEGIICSNLTAENIADGVTVKIGTATDDDSVASVTGTHQGGGGGVNLYQFHFNNVDIYGDTYYSMRSVEKLSDYGLTIDDFVVSSTHHVVAWVDFSSTPQYIEYTDENDDDSFTAQIGHVNYCETVDGVTINNQINEMIIPLHCKMIKTAGTPLWSEFYMSNYANGTAYDAFMMGFDDGGFDVTNNSSPGTGRRLYNPRIQGATFTINIAIFDT